jgi:hypothetical protein
MGRTPGQTGWVSQGFQRQSASDGETGLLGKRIARSLRLGLNEQISGVIEQVRGWVRATNEHSALRCGREELNKPLLPPRQAELEALAKLAGASISSVPMSVMTSDDNSLSLILHRLDEIERKLDRMRDELEAPTAIGYSARRGNRPRKD